MSRNASSHYPWYIDLPEGLSTPGYRTPGLTGGDLTGTGADNRIARWDGTNTLQSSLVTITDAGAIQSEVAAAGSFLVGLVHETGALDLRGGSVGTTGIVIYGSNHGSVPNVVIFNNSGAESGRILSTGVMQWAQAVLATGSTAGAVAFGAVGDTDTGIYFPAANQMAGAVAGSNVFTCTTSNFQTSLNVQTAVGSVGAPSLSFVSDPDTGVYRSAANVLGLAVGGVAGLIVDGASSYVTIASGYAYRGGLGSVSSPLFCFTGDENTGLYSAGADELDFTAGGVHVGSVNGTAWGLTRDQISCGVGTAATQVAINVAVVNTGNLALTGGTATTQNAVLKLFGQSHASRANVTVFENNNAETGSISSAGLWTINNSLSVTQDVTIGSNLIMTGQVIASTATINALSSTTTYVKFSGSTATQINGIASGVDGKIIHLTSIGANLTIANQNVGATGADRIYTNTAGDVALTAPCMATLIYDGTAGGWVLLSNLA